MAGGMPRQATLHPDAGEQETTGRKRAKFWVRAGEGKRKTQIARCGWRHPAYVPRGTFRETGGKLAEIQLSAGYTGKDDCAVVVMTAAMWEEDSDGNS